MLGKDTINRWTVFLENTLRELEDPDRIEQVNWFFDEVDASLGHIMCCEHGLSATSCYGPGHFYGAYMR